MNEVYVRPFPDVYGSLTQISSRGGRRPVWSPTADELLFVRDRQINGVPVGGDELVSVDVNPGTSFDVGEERVLFSEPLGIDYWGMTPDGQRFAIVRGARDTARFTGLGVIIVENWFEELKGEGGR